MERASVQLAGGVGPALPMGVAAWTEVQGLEQVISRHLQVGFLVGQVASSSSAYCGGPAHDPHLPPRLSVSPSHPEHTESGAGLPVVTFL